MSDIKTYVAGWIGQAVEGLETGQIQDLLEYPPDAAMGDLSLPCFKLSKILRKSPQQIADGLKQTLPSDEWIARTDSVNGYFNIFVNRGKVAAQFLSALLAEPEKFGATIQGEGKTVVIDYSSPNIAKPFHVGHLRSTVIGHALKMIHEHLGYRVVGINHLGDWGTQFGKLIVAYKRFGEEQAVREGGIQELLRLYVLFYEKAEAEPALEDEARGWFTRLEQGDEEATRLWEWFKQVSLDEFNRMYDLLGVTFDSYAGESFYNDQLPAVVDALKEKGLLINDDGAALVDLEAHGMPPCLILKKDGSSLYATRDLAAAIYRAKTYDFDKCIYVTGSPQILHFQQWFKVIGLMGYEWASKLLHVPFGQVSLGGEKFSTRKGNVVLLDELIGQAVAKTKEIMADRNLPDLESIADQVGIGAVVFGDLSHNRIKDISFTWEDVLNFDGETGPYVQYTHVRATSVLRKAGLAESGAGHSAAIRTVLAEPGEFALAAWSEPTAFALIQELQRLPERFQSAADKLEPSIVTRHLIDLAQAFNHFYHANKILVDDTQERDARLALVAAAKEALALGLRMIGVAAPVRM